MKVPSQPSFRIIFAGAAGATLLVVLITNASAAERQVVQGHLVRAVTELNLRPVGTLASSTNLDLVIGLPLRNKEALTNLLQQQYAPTSPEYHHWLTPEEFTARFGPTEQDYQAVIEFAKANGFTITGTHSNRTLLDMRGSVAAIERTFRVTLLTYQHPTEAREFYAPDVEPSLDLTVTVMHITGLDNYSVPRPVSIREASQKKAVDVTPASGSGPSGSYSGKDFRYAYAPGVSLTGSGQVVALVEFDGYYANDITAYEASNGLANVTLTNALVDGATGSPNYVPYVEEVSLDIEMAISMAPGLSRVIVYEGPSTDTTDSDAIDTLNRIATDDLAKQVSCSWQLQEAFGTTNFDQIYQQYAMQGQSFFQASGDNGAYCTNYPNQEWADSPYVTLVGGTTLTTTGPEGAWETETVWNNNIGTASGATNDASGGGVSTNYTIPSWQQGIDMTFNQGSTSMRNVPDVAMVAHGIYVIYNNGSTTSIGGTSCAAPLWAGFTALVNQQAVAYGQTAVGFINPAIYAIGTGTTYDTCFHDIILGNNETYYSPFQFSAAFGYDLCTGWGTPNGSNLVNALAPQPESDLTRYTDSLDIYYDESAGSYDVSAGNTFIASITVTNQACPGGGTAAGPFHVGFYWSTDSSFGGLSAAFEVPVSGCAEGGSVLVTNSFTIDQTVTPGIYYLGYKIDDSNEVVECNETDKGIFYWTVTVFSPCSLTVSPASVKLPAKGGSKTVKVKAKGTDCTWTAASNDPFITITEGGSGTGNGTVHYTVPGNTNTVPQTGTITIAGQTVTVNQAAGGCTFKLSPKSAKFSFVGTVAEAKTVKVKPNFGDCTWTAVSTDPFITITEGASGVGNGTVSYTVTGNTNNTPLTGTITIGGETFTITESAAP